MLQTRVTELLDEAGITYEVRLHSRSVFTVDEAAVERGVHPRQLVKVMVVRPENQGLVAVLVPGDRRLDLKKLRQTLGVKRVRLATPDEIQLATGSPVGAISPIGLDEMALFVDRGIAQEQIVAMSSGSPDAGILLASADLIELVGGEMGDFA
jgi:Cys-tRNA(Pro) deacylase